MSQDVLISLIFGILICAFIGCWAYYLLSGIKNVLVCVVKYIKKCISTINIEEPNLVIPEKKVTHSSGDTMSQSKKDRINKRFEMHEAYLKSIGISSNIKEKPITTDPALRILGYEKQSLIELLFKVKKVPIIDPTSIVVAHFKDGSPCFGLRYGSYSSDELRTIKRSTKAEWKDITDERNRLVREQNKILELQQAKRENAQRIEKAKISIMKRAMVWYDEGCDNNYSCRVGVQCRESEGWMIPIIEDLVCRYRHNERELCSRINAL